MTDVVELDKINHREAGGEWPVKEQTGRKSLIML
jgi:hypothetical protein